MNTHNSVFLNLNKFEKRHKVNTFKSLVNFKRFNFKLTKFKRKTMSRFKHTANWLIYTNVIKTWTLDYTFNRHFIKNQFLVNILVFNSYVYNFNFSKIRNECFSYNFNFSFSTLTKKSYFYFNKTPGSLIKNNNVTFIWHDNDPILNNSVVVAFSEWDSILYSLNNNSPLRVQSTFNFESLVTIHLDTLLTHVIELRKIFTVLILNKLNR